MKTLTMLLVALLLLAGVAFADPMPKYGKATTFANDETFYLGVRGKQTGLVYRTAYVTLQSTQDVYVEFDPAAELSGYYTVAESAAWGGATYTYTLGQTVFCPSSTKVVVKVAATSFKFSGVTVAGDMEVWAEYDE